MVKEVKFRFRKLRAKVKQQVIVTGAAGYIGSHICNELISQGFSVIAIDDLSTGRQEFINPKATFFNGKVQDANFLKLVFNEITSPDSAGVIHCAGLKYAGESVSHPLDYYDNNTTAVSVLLLTMNQYRIRNLVFSSSCSVYGSIGDLNKIDENHSLNPISPYGKSKYFAEQIILDAISAYGLRAVALRYFNVAGNGTGIGHDLSPFNLLPNLYRAVKDNKDFSLYGNTFDTPDGSCIRDYVDVTLLAKAHVRTLTKLVNKENLSFAYNLGSGLGTSVLQIIEAVKKVTGFEINTIIYPPRIGDPSKVMADISLAQKDLGWDHNMTTEQMVHSGWKAWNKS